jgi:hypothetical protein
VLSVTFTDAVRDHEPSDEAIEISLIDLTRFAINFAR